MRLKQLQYILEVSKHKSITKAAKQLFISQPSLSSAISNLEQELNTKIFNRTHDGVEPTEIGRFLIEKASRILREVEEINNMCINSSVYLNGNLTVSTLPAMSNHILLEAFSIFKGKYPQVNISIKEDDTSNIMQEIKTGELDIGIISFWDYDKEEFLYNKRKNDIQYEELFTDDFCLFTATDHILSQKQQVQVEDIQYYPLVVFKNNMSDRDIEVSMKFKHLNVMRFNDRESMKKVIARGNAVALLPRVMSLNDIYVQSGKIRPLTISDFKTNLHIGIVYRKDYLQITQKKFIMTIKDIVNTLVEDSL